MPGPRPDPRPTSPPDMEASPHSDAILLLCAPMRGSPVRALGPGEYHQLAKWLNDRGLGPRDLLDGGTLDALRAGSPTSRLDAGRVESLLGRGVALGLARQSWRDAGLFALTRADAAYPKRLRRLGNRMPPVLFGFGNLSALNDPGLGVVGSRDADPEALDTARRLGRLAYESGVSLVSGGARGIDETAMLAALDAGGVSIGVLSHDLLRGLRRRSYRPALERGRLLLLSPYRPDSGFNVGQAMGRNKLIYALSNAVVAVTCTHSRGGTWAGATENLEAPWRVPLWVPPRDTHGLAALRALGARVLPEPLPGADRLFSPPAPPPSRPPTDTVAPAEKRGSETTQLLAKLLANFPEGFTRADLRGHLGVSDYRARKLTNGWLASGALEKTRRGRSHLFAAAAPGGGTGGSTELCPVRQDTKGVARDQLDLL